MPTQSYFVTWSGDGCHIEFFISEDSHYLNKHEKLIYLSVHRCVRITTFEKIFDASVAFNIRQIVVGMFATSIDMIKWLFMEERSESVPLICFLHNLHD